MVSQQPQTSAYRRVDASPGILAVSAEFSNCSAQPKPADPLAFHHPDGYNPSNNLTSRKTQNARRHDQKVDGQGFGFIKTDTKDDLFFHSSAVQGATFEDLQEGQKVSYTAGQGPKGPRAENVKLV